MSKYSLTPEQHRRRAQRLWHRHARAAEMHELAGRDAGESRKGEKRCWQPLAAKRTEAGMCAAYISFLMLIIADAAAHATCAARARAL
jgi:hypothetical protein